MLIPEIILYHNIKSILDFVKKDYIDNTDKTRTLLYKLCKVDDYGLELKFHNFDYYEQAVKLLVTNQDVTNSRKIEISFGYNLNRKGLPSIHILLPSETSGEIGLGMGEGYANQEVTPPKEVEGGVTIPGVVRTYYTNASKSTYSILITSDNSSEAVLLYHLLKNLLFACFPAFELRGIRDPKFGGQDLQFSNELVPPEIFHRNLSLDFFYESSVPSFDVNQLINSIVFVGTPEQ